MKIIANRESIEIALARRINAKRDEWANLRGFERCRCDLSIVLQASRQAMEDRKREIYKL